MLDAAAMPLQAGLIIGVYELVAPLGRGGMGDVYRARDRRLGRYVAIKFVSSRLYGNADAEARLDREARTASALNHPGIVTVFDVGRHDERPYVVMELIEGQPLSARTAESRMPIKEAVDIAAQIADGLAAAHDAGVIHRDLKPQNIMVTSEGRTKIVDFGLSKMAPPPSAGTADTIQGDALTGNYAVLGTAGYMAPEQVMGAPADARADQFALGAILYELLTGRRAFHRDSTVQTMSSILEDEPAPIAAARADVPANVVAIVSRCLAKRPERRYASTRDLAHDLRDAHEQIVIESRSGHQSLRPRLAARRWVAAGVVALVAIIIGAASWSRFSTGANTPVTPTASLRYIVVMPFANVTKDAADQVFADGLAETLTSTLTQLERYQRLLRVVPASEVRAGRIDSIRDAQQAFGATLAISGSIQRLPSTLRLTLNLVDAVQLVQLGSRTIDIRLADEIMTQDTVADAATALLALELEPAEKRALTAGGTSAPRAYELYVQGRGYLYRFDRAENVERAIDVLGRAVAADPRYALAHTALAEAFWRKYESGRDAAVIDRAVAHCEQALSIDSRLAPVHVTLAMLARGRGRYEEAIAVSQRAIELDPVNSEAHRELGRAQEALRRFADAEATYRKAVDARPDDWQAYNTLGGFYAARSRWPEAEAAYQRVIELTPDNTRGYNNLGVTYFRMQRGADAARMWERSLGIRPNFSAASNLGSYYYNDGRYADAARAFERAVALAPNDVRVWRNLASALHWAPGERPKAVAAFKKVVELAEAEIKVNPRQPALLAQLASAHSMLGSRAEAIAAATAVERLGAPDAETTYTVAGAYEQIGDRAAALNWLEQSIAKGYSLDLIDRSPSLAELRKDPRYQTLVNKEVAR